MDQMQTGKFIAELRKEKSLTQAQLGELVGVTNKTVSRWENGNYMPDLAVLQSLCAVLDVSINEMISGRRLDEADFRQQADNNLLLSLDQAQRMRREYKLIDFFTGAGTGSLIGMLTAPDSVRRSVVIVISLTMIVIGQVKQWRFGRQLMGLLDKVR